MFALGSGTEHWNVGHNNDIVFRTHGLFFAEDIDAFRIETERAVGVLNDVFLGPGLTEMVGKLEIIRMRFDIRILENSFWIICSALY